MAGREEPGRSGEDQQETNSGGGEVEGVHVLHGPALGQVENDEDEGGPDAGNPTNGLGEPTQVELVLDKGLGADSDAEQDGDGVRDSETNDGDTRDGAQGSSRAERGQSQNDDDNDREPDETQGHAGALVEDSPEGGEGETAITGKGVKHARVGSNGGNTAEETGKDNDEDQDAATSLAGGVDEDLLCGTDGRGNGGVVVLDTEGKGKGKAETNHDGGKDGHEDTAGAVDIGLFSLF